MKTETIETAEPALVRRFVVQECDPRHEAYGWYDDPSCDERETLQSAKYHLESDTAHEGHARLFSHRIIERIERVVYAQNVRVSEQTTETKTL